ncbi:hypothetical protein BaRGS_00010600 [Batillaria attramentaria]|uniref:Uncharacterized protein n=1 Tax=Batillaria attramentaria TaxID=370345 RepID=A0ABD0LG25_9CAEN
MDPRIAWYPPEHLGRAHDLWTRVWETQLGVDSMFSDQKQQQEFIPLDGNFDQNKRLVLQNIKNAENQQQSIAQKRKRDNRACTYGLNHSSQKVYLGEDGGLTPWKRKISYEPSVVGVMAGAAAHWELELQGGNETAFSFSSQGL